MSLQNFLQLVVTSLQQVCILSLATMGIVIIFKTSFTTNFAQGSLATFGAFTTAILTASRGVPYVLAVLIGILTGFIFGVLIDVLLFRRSRKVTFVGKQIITMGLVLLISGAIPLIFGVLPIPVARFAVGTREFMLFNQTIIITNHLIVSLIVTSIVLGTLFTALKYTKWGLGVRATASNEMVAGMMGVNTRIITALSWGIAGGLGSIAALMYAPLTQINPLMMVSTQVNGFLASILGGFSTFYGPIVGAFLIPTVGDLISYNYSTWKMVMVYVLILIVILIRPMGLFGKKIAKKV